MVAEVTIDIKLTSMYKEKTNGEKKHQKELYLLKQKGKRKVNRVVYEGGESDGKGAQRKVVSSYESRHLRDFKNGKKFKRYLTPKQKAKMCRQ